MKNEDLIERISQMPYEDLLKKVQRIREARVDAKAASEGRKTRKARPKKSTMDKLVDKMSEEERAKLIAMLEGEKK